MNLYLRLLKILLLLPFVRRRGPLDESRVTFRVWPTDCDLNFHMNNGRYLTFMDLGRAHLVAQTGLLAKMIRRGWRPVLNAAEITFIRPLAPFQKFDLVTRLLTWDEKYFYMEQRFEIERQLCAVGLVRGLFLARSVRIPSSEIINVMNHEAPASTMPEMVRHWNEMTALKKDNNANVAQ